MGTHYDLTGSNQGIRPANMKRHVTSLLETAPAHIVDVKDEDFVVE